MPLVPTLALSWGLALTSGCALVGPAELQWQGAPVVDSVEPVTGSLEGGEQVTVRGSGFDEDTTVWFGDVQAEVLSGEGDRLVVRTPAWPEPERVRLRASNGDANGDLPEAFTFLYPGQDRTGLIGAVERFAYVGGYWTELPEPAMSGWLRVLQPWDQPWYLYWGPGIDDCETDYSVWEELQPYDVAGTSLTLVGAAQDLVMEPDETDTFQLPWGQIAVDDGWLDSGAYDLVFSGHELIPDTQVDAAVTTPGNQPDVTLPAIGADEVPTAGPSFDLYWSAPGADLILVYLQLYNSTQSTVVETMRCVLENDGNFQVPDLWTQWETNRRVDVLIGAASTSDAVVPYDGSDSGIVGLSWSVGALFGE